MKLFKGKVAVITGGASGLGWAVAQEAASRGMRVVLADVQADALANAADTLRQSGCDVLTQIVDVSKADQVEALAEATLAAFGVPSFLFNNAGVAAGGLIWEHTRQDWEWVIGVNVMGVAHGVRVFTPLMLRAAKEDPHFEGTIVNTASMAGLLNAPNMGVYNVSKHAVVALSETLYQDLALVTDQIHAAVLCPFFVPTSIHRSERNRPTDMQSESAPTHSQLVAQALSDKAVTSGRVTPQEVAQRVFSALEENRFYIYSHPQALGSVQVRMEDVVQGRNPTDPFAGRPDVGERLRQALRDPSTH